MVSGLAVFLHVCRLYVLKYLVVAIMLAIALALLLTGCETPNPTPHGVNITLNGNPVFVHPGTKIVTRDPMTGRFIAPRVIEP